MKNKRLKRKWVRGRRTREREKRKKRWREKRKKWIKNKVK